MRWPPLFFLLFTLFRRLKFHRLRAIVFAIKLQFVVEKPFRERRSFVPTSWRIHSCIRRDHEIPADKRERGGVTEIHWRDCSACGVVCNGI